MIEERISESVAKILKSIFTETRLTLKVAEKYPTLKLRCNIILLVTF